LNKEARSLERNWAMPVCLRSISCARLINRF
jgi:hypothetical protein